MKRYKFNQLVERAFYSLEKGLWKDMLACPISYKTSYIPKRNGGVRTIDEPNEELKNVQRVLLPFFYHWPTAESIFGFQPYRSVMDNARFHIVGNYAIPRWIVKLDLENAFPSATSELMEKVFLWMFEPLRVKDLLKVGRNNLNEAYRGCVQLMLRLTTYNGRLPQGAPTSPFLLNLALVHSGVVKKLKHFCNTRSEPLKFSIYADDITVSSKRERISDRTIERIGRIIEESGYFKVNHQKTRRNRLKDKAHKITGVVLTYDENEKVKLTLPQSEIRTLKGKIHRAAIILGEGGKLDFERDKITIGMIWGYIGWIRSIYQGSKIPSGVNKAVELFEETFRGGYK